ncbi:MAG: ribose-phosphate pyrophosphokinase [Myxococcales bacterium]|nr:ribose-phosphate pyrophosphokinase [Myxococcales bacterium]MDH5305870.1 ribose-phosphate pyrophosphokinase [Myxococcales bacterium]MDH5566431.1 ribose-phosphate pyrophosphokinase [Myxococcales bacterium]
MQKLKLFTGNANPALARAVADHLGIALGKAEVGQFSDGEVNVEIGENVRGSDCFVVQPTCAPANTHLMELLIMIDALRRSSARRITAVIPYYGYARQDRKVRPRLPISAKLVADLISVAATDRLLCIDLHAGQIQGFFNIPVDNLYATPVLLEAITSRYGTQPLTIVSPDAGGVERSRAYAKRLDATLAIVDKRREAANVAEVMNIIGDVQGRTCVVVDDIVDTAGTLTEAARALKDAGASVISAAITHPVLSGPAIKRINESPIEELVVTDTVPLREDARSCEKLRVVSIASLLSEAIRRINNEESVSSLFV